MEEPLRFFQAGRGGLGDALGALYMTLSFSLHTKSHVRNCGKAGYSDVTSITARHSLRLFCAHDTMATSWRGEVDPQEAF